MKNLIKACGLAAAVVTLSACATVTRGTSQKFKIETTPTQAEVKLSSGQQCISPCQLKLKRKPGFTATIKKQGYKTQELKIVSKLAGGGAVAGAGNIILGGVIGGIVDGTNGSMNNLTPNPLRVTLVPDAQAAPVAAAAAPADAALAAAQAEAATIAPTVPVEATPVAAPTPGGE